MHIYSIVQKPTFLVNAGCVVGAGCKSRLFNCFELVGLKIPGKGVKIIIAEVSYVQTSKQNSK
jgi:hypothetical protein